MVSRHYKSLLLAPAALLLLAIVAVPVSPAASGAGFSKPDHQARLDSRLTQVAQAFDEGGQVAAEDEARAVGLSVRDGGVRVVIEMTPGAPSGHAFGGLGIGIETTHGNLVQALVPPGMLRALSEVPFVEGVRPPLEAVSMVTSEGVSLTNAGNWHAQGITGAGVKVAVLDLGFQGYTSRLGTELPTTVTVMSFRADGDIGGGTSHGVGVAEIVHDMAPGAQLYFANFETEVELGNAAEWLTAQGIQAINASWGFFTAGPGDGTGVVNDIVNSSTSDGALWSVAAGNHAMRHWSGQFRDTDGNLFHEFSAPPAVDEGNQITGGFFGLVFPGETVGVEMKWDDPFGAACQDYNLFVMRTDDAGAPVTVASSENVQNNGTDCVPGANPVETVLFSAPVADTYHIVVKKSVATRDARLDIYSLLHDVEYVVSANSLGQPADNAGVLTNGAVYYGTPGTIESFSSRGPTTDGRVKPDLVNPDGVSNATLGSFFGTSAAAPHGTGAVALVKQRLACYTPAQIRAVLEANTVGLGSPGKDNTYGAGRLSLGGIPPDSDGDGTGDACEGGPTPTPADTASPSPTASPTSTESPTPTPSPSPTPTPTPTPSPSPSTAPSPTPSPSPSPSPPPTPTPTPTPTPSPTPSPTLSPTPSPTQGPSVHVGDLDGKARRLRKGSGWEATVTITVHTGAEALLGAATVSGHWDNGPTNSVSCLTSSSGANRGKCSLSYGPLLLDTPEARFTVDTIVAGGFAYHATANHDPDVESNGSTITISR